jgi:uncharacterized DUF497 family protein
LKRVQRSVLSRKVDLAIRKRGASLAFNSNRECLNLWLRQYSSFDKPKEQSNLQNLNLRFATANQKLYNHLLSKQEDVALPTLLATPYTRGAPIPQLLLIVAFDFRSVLSIEDPD